MTYRKALLAAGSVMSLASFLCLEPLLTTPSQAQMFYGKVGQPMVSPMATGFRATVFWMAVDSAWPHKTRSARLTIRCASSGKWARRAPQRL